MTDARVWRAASVDRRVSVPLDTLTAVFDRASGQTHLITSPLPEILDALGQDGRTVAALHAQLAETFDLPDAADDAGIILIARLEELAALGLVRGS